MRRAFLVFLLGMSGTLVVVFGVMLLTRDDGNGESTGAPTSTLASASTAGSVATSSAPDVVSTVASSAPVTVPPTVVVTTVPAGRCAGLTAMVLPAGVELSGGQGNFDGPPEPESIMDADGAFVFESSGTWYVGFSLHDGYVVFEPLPAASPPGFVPEARVWDFGSSDDGLLVKIDRSALSGAEVYAFYFLDTDCQIEDAGTMDVERYEFLDWFGASHTQAFTCTDDGVFETSAGQSGSLWDVRDAFYEWTAPAGPGFVFGFEDGTEVPEGDPAIAAAGEVNC